MVVRTRNMSCPGAGQYSDLSKNDLFKNDLFKIMKIIQLNKG
jgi:hypothetical protein